MEEQLLFVIGSPRSGTTLLTRMLGGHSKILDGPEAHLITPLAHLGYFERVREAPYDPIVAERGVREFVKRLPGEDEDYIAACRAYSDHLYRRMLDTKPGKEFLLDKTPAYALVLPFLARLYPRARYVVLTRTPLAILASVANSFFDGDFEVANRHNPILDRYVPAIARFLRAAPCPLVHVRYEQLVRDPDRELGAIFDFLGVERELGAVEYGAREEGPETDRALGDPIGIAQHSRPVTDSIESWAGEVAAEPGRLALCRRVLDGLEDADLETWGYDRAEILASLVGAEGREPRPRTALSRYTLERKLLVQARRLTRADPVRGLLVSLRRGIDMLLR